MSLDLTLIVSQFNFKMGNSRHKTVYEFEGFRLDAAHLLLYQNGQEILLAPKVVETLLALVERRGEVLCKEELMELVWADSIVEEGNLSQNLYRLRRILGEGKNGKPLIETLRRRGYRFNGEVKIIKPTNSAENNENVLAFAPLAAPVSGKSLSETKHGQVVALAEWQPQANDSAPASEDELENRSAENRAVSDTIPVIKAPLLNRKLMAIGGLLIVLASAVAVWKITNQNHYQAATDMLAGLRIKSLVSWNAEAGEGYSQARFSPNGSMIAYSRTKNGQRNIWTKQIPDGNPNQIINGEWSYFNPIWSPDGQRIAFVSNRDNQIGIWTMPFSGGELTLVKAVDGNINLLHWSKNGATIYYQQGFNLFALDVFSRQITRLTSFDLNNQAQFFNISPAENRIAYAAGPNEGLHIFVMALDGDSQPVQMTNEGVASDEYPFWLPDGERIIYSSKRDGIFQTYIVYLNERKSEPLNIDGSDTLISDVAADGDKILFSQSIEESDLWQANLAEKNETQITSALGLELWSDVSPDGKTIVFQAATESKHLLEGSLLISSTDDKQQINIASNGFSPAFSPDGSKVAFLREADSSINLWVTGRNGAGERRLTTEGVLFANYTLVPYNRLQVKDYSWSPDGGSLIYCANKYGNIWQVAADGTNAPQQITANTNENVRFSCPLFAPDGKRIVYLSTAVNSSANAKPKTDIHLLSGENSEILFSSASVFRLIGWEQSGRDLIIAIPEEKPVAKPTKVRLALISAGNNRTDLASIEAAYFYNIQLSPDGRWIACATREDGKDNIRVISVAGGESIRITANADPTVYISGIVWSPDGKAVYYGKQKKVGTISMIENFK